MITENVTAFPSDVYVLSSVVVVLDHRGPIISNPDRLDMRLH